MTEYNPALAFLQTAVLAYIGIGALVAVVLPDMIRTWRIGRWGRNVALLLSVLLWSTYSVAAADAAPEMTATALSEEFWRWVATQGGLTLVVIVLGWSYRRDLVGALMQHATDSNRLIETVSNNAVTIQAVRDSLIRLASAIETQPCIARRHGGLEEDETR